MRSAPLLLVVVALGCSDAARPGDAGPRPRAPATTTPRATAAPLVVEGQGTAHCIQIRSLPARDEAQALAARVEQELELATHLFEADLGPRGLWYRLCVGAFPDEATARARADEWTAAGGRLRPVMDEIAPGQAAYLVKERPAAADTLPDALRAAIAALPFTPARARISDGATGPLVLVDGTSATARQGAVLDWSGAVLVVDDAPAPGCAVCAEALARPGPRALVPLLAAELSRHAGREIVVEELLADGARILSVLVSHEGGLRRTGSQWLGRGDAARSIVVVPVAVDVDGGPVRELLVVRHDLALDGARVCAMATVADLVHVDALGLTRVDVTRYTKERPLPWRRVLEILDAHDEHEKASLLCADAAKAGDAALIRACTGRVVELQRQGLLVDAVSAGGILAERTPSVRALVATPLLAAAQALAAAEERTVIPDDCARAPLLDDAPGPHDERTVAKARATARARHDLGELHDAVFVTAARDFGPGTPFHRVAMAFLDDIEAVLPARAAAIRALLVDTKGSR